ncbi:hypothetical protein [Candidatus Weimeria sp. HCP3S3_B5]|uniref:hypothetical protein n=1 Tax=Candidatus Weimeria sp. HCP3S3_B5 TaxID=3438871 RepID=UPI003F8A85D4
MTKTKSTKKIRAMAVVMALSVAVCGVAVGVSAKTKKKAKQPNNLNHAAKWMLAGDEQYSISDNGGATLINTKWIKGPVKNIKWKYNKDKDELTVSWDKYKGASYYAVKMAGDGSGSDGQVDKLKSLKTKEGYAVTTKPSITVLNASKSQGAVAISAVKKTNHNKWRRYSEPINFAYAARAKYGHILMYVWEKPSPDLITKKAIDKYGLTAPDLDDYDTGVYGKELFIHPPVNGRRSKADK